MFLRLHHLIAPHLSACAAPAAAAAASCAVGHSLRAMAALAGGDLSLPPPPPPPAMHAAYVALLDGGGLRPDMSQQAAVAALAALQAQLLEALAPPPPPGAGAAPPQPQMGAGFAQSLGAGRPAPRAQGAFLFGSIGSGKTALMDLFLSSTPDWVPAPGGGRAPLRKRRAHFHDFMADVHARLHAQQEALPRQVRRTRDGHPVYRCVPLPPRRRRRRRRWRTPLAAPLAPCS
jgi:hypothetical protein